MIVCARKWRAWREATSFAVRGRPAGPLAKDGIRSSVCGTEQLARVGTTKQRVWLEYEACMEAGVSLGHVLWRFPHVHLQSSFQPGFGVLGDYRSVKEIPEAAATGLGRF